MPNALVSRAPCTSCPWRVGVDAWAIGRDHTPDVPPLHRAEMERVAARNLFPTSMAKGSVMACHLAHRNEEALPPAERLCRGYALSREGRASLLLRLLAIRGEVDLSAIHCAEPLHPDFAAMLAANPEREREAP